MDAAGTANGPIKYLGCLPFTVICTHLYWGFAVWLPFLRIYVAPKVKTMARIFNSLRQRLLAQNLPVRLPAPPIYRPYGTLPNSRISSTHMSSLRD